LSEYGDGYQKEQNNQDCFKIDKFHLAFFLGENLKTRFKVCRLHFSFWWQK